MQTVEAQKQSGEFNAQGLLAFAETVSPMLSDSQNAKLRELLEMLQ